MPENLFFLGSDGAPTTMTPAAFLSEDEFQSLLDRFPELLTDNDFGEGSARRWVLVRREAGITDREAGGERWAVDHLFLDQAGVPTLVEVKRASDSRSRREVVAQMLDYAANCVSWWRIDDLVEWFELSSRARGQTTAERLAILLDNDAVDSEEFWRQVDSNLRSGRIRMLFVADYVAPELQRIVEFLNEQMRPATVAALELRLYSDGSGRILAPRIIGATQRAIQTKNVTASSTDVSVDAFLQALDVDRRRSASAFIDLMALHSAVVRGAGQQLAADVRSARADSSNRVVRPFYLVRSGSRLCFKTSLYMLSHSAAFSSDETRQSLVNFMKEIGFDASKSKSPIVSEVLFDLPPPDDVAGWRRVRTLVDHVYEALSRS